jgi:hypothetical protein
MNRFLVLLALSVASADAHATDGVIEINHARALAGGITPGDAPGYPVTIDQPGSYRLTGNLSQADANTDVIYIAANNVSIDLNGFAITGSNVCQPIPNNVFLGCTTNNGNTGLGITGVRTLPGLGQVIIRNGSIRGMAGSCLHLNNNMYGDVWVDHVQVQHCGNHGIVATRISNSSAAYSSGIGLAAAQVTDSMATRNGVAGIRVELSDGIAARNLSTWNGGSGFTGSGLFVNNSAYHNGGAGLAPSEGALIGNTVTSNTGYGLDATGLVTFSGNTLRNNAAGAVNGTAHSVPPGSNWCGGAVCPM